MLGCGWGKNCSVDWGGRYCECNQRTCSNPALHTLKNNYNIRSFPENIWVSPSPSQGSQPVQACPIGVCKAVSSNLLLFTEKIAVGIVYSPEVTKQFSEELRVACFLTLASLLSYSLLVKRYMQKNLSKTACLYMLLMGKIFNIKSSEKGNNQRGNCVNR